MAGDSGSMTQPPKSSKADDDLTRLSGFRRLRFQPVQKHMEETQFRLVIQGDGSVRTVPLNGQRWTIGRSTDCSITLPDPTVSRRHLLIERSDDRFEFRDLGGANPVHLDGRPVRRGELRVGSLLTIGLTNLRLDARQRPSPLASSGDHTVVLAREVVDDELQPEEGGHAATASRILQSIEWTFADLGDLGDAAEPLLQLALNLTGHRSGWLARFPTPDTTETLATASLDRDSFSPRLPEGALHDAHRIGAPHLLTTREGDADVQRLLVPLGQNGEGLLVLEDPGDATPDGQQLLRLAQSLGSVVWHRLQETMERLRLRTELRHLRFHGTDTHNALLTSSRLQQTREAVRSRANAAMPTLLQGEQGTEREELARYLHAESSRRDAPFVSWNPRKAAAERRERELFGDTRQPGLLHDAAGGTLFVDDFGALEHDLQRRLFEHVDSGADPRMALVVAIDDSGPGTDLHDDVEARLRSHTIEIPPLREDARDILALAELFLSELGACPDGSPRLLTERARRVLTAHCWPGNVRELRLTIEAAAARAGSQPIAPRHLPVDLTSASDADGPQLPSLSDVEQQHIREVMKRTGGVRTRAAQILGIANSTLYEKLKKYGID